MSDKTVDPQQAHEDFLRQTRTTTTIPTASKGAWVTLHLTPASGRTEPILGYVTGSEGGMIKLTKLVTVKYAVDLDGEGEETCIHEGAWFINPTHVWMIEHEKHIPEAKFRLYSKYPHLRT